MNLLTIFLSGKNSFKETQNKSIKIINRNGKVDAGIYKIEILKVKKCINVSTNLKILRK